MPAGKDHRFTEFATKPDGPQTSEFSYVANLESHLPIFSKIRILHIEDNEDDALIMQRMLGQIRSAQFEVERAKSLGEGLDRLGRESHDVVILDLSLPDSRGLETFIQANARAPTLPFVLMTGFNDEKLAIKALHAGAQDYLVKGNVDSNLLFRSIRYAIERKRAATAVRESEERLRGVLDNAPAVIYLKDIQGRYLRINRHYEDLFKIKNETLLGKTDFDFFPREHAEKFVANDRKVLDAGTPLEFEEIASQDDGAHTYLSIKFPLYDAKGNIYAICGISTDITLRKRAEENLRAMQNELIQAGKLAALGQMAAGISHELNQPLEAIQAYIDNLAVLLVEKRYEEAQSNLSAVSGLTRHAGKIIGHIKTFARKKPEPIQPVSLQSSIENTLSFLHVRARLEEVKIVKEMPAEDVFVMANMVQLEQVFLNIISNAFDAMDDCRQRKLHISLAADSKTASVIFRDTGKGIPGEFLPKLFDPFFTTKEMGKGLGLGLSISLSIIQGFRGNIQASNHSEGGATFTVTFPRAAAEASRP